MNFKKMEFNKDFLIELVKCTKKMYALNGLKNEALDTLMDKLEELDCNENFYELVQSHVNTMYNVVVKQKSAPKSLTELKFESTQEHVDFAVAQIFVENIKSFSKVQVEAKQAQHFDLELPLEAFLRNRQRNNTDKENFVNSLEKFDILYGEIVDLNITKLCTKMIQLRVISKVDEENTIVYHLNISAFLLKCKELDHLQRSDASVSEILKVAVTGFLPDEEHRTAFVSTYRNLNAEHIRFLNLGFVSPNDLPFDLCLFKSASMFQSYVQYLRSSPDFLHLIDLNDMMESLGIDPYRIYAFSEKRDGLTCSPTLTVEALKKRAQQDLQAQSDLWLEVALKCVEEKEIKPALTAFDNSIKISKKNYKAYEARGKMFVDLVGLKSSSDLRKVCLDFENALYLNPNAEVSKAYYSKILTYFAGRTYKKEKYETAKTYILAALTLKANDEFAIKLLDKTNKKINKSRDVVVLDEEEYLKQLETRLIQLSRLVKK